MSDYYDEDRVHDRMVLIKSEHPDGDYPSPLHDEGECLECDALRELNRRQIDGEG